MKFGGINEKLKSKEKIVIFTKYLLKTLGSAACIGVKKVERVGAESTQTKIRKKYGCFNHNRHYLSVGGLINKNICR